MPEHSVRKKLNCILLIDDDPATNFLHKMIIEQAQIAHEIKIVYNGREAMDYLLRSTDGDAADPLESPEPDLIFLDINMPVMDGWEFLDAYEAHFPTGLGAVVICMLSTALPRNVEDKLERQKIEISNFIEKPLRRNMLFEIMENYFPEYMERV